MKTLIKNARVISPGIDLSGAAIEICGKTIVAIHEAGSPLPSADVVIDVAGSMVMPGFIDIHSHGAGGFDVCDGSLEGIRTIAQCKLKEGVTTWLPTTLTLAQETLEDVCRVVAQYMENQEFVKTPGIHVEGPFVNPKCCGAQNPAFLQKPNFENLMRMHNIAPALLVSLAPEMEESIEFIRKATAMGIRCSAAHSAATYDQLMKAKAAGLTNMTHFCNQMTPLHHREIGMVGAGFLDDDLKMEHICDCIHLCPNMLRLIYKVANIDKLMMITDSMAASWLPDGESSLGGLPVVVENGAARIKETGALAGSTLRYNVGVGNVARLSGRPLSEVVKATGWNQAQVLGLTDRGKIAPGYAADLAILDGDFNVTKTLVDGVVKFG